MMNRWFPPFAGMVMGIVVMISIISKQYALVGALLTYFIVMHIVRGMNDD